MGRVQASAAGGPEGRPEAHGPDHQHRGDHEEQFPAALLQERLLRYGAQPAQPLPHEPDRAGAGAEGRTARAGLAELVLDEAVRQLPVLYERHPLAQSTARAILHEDLSGRRRRNIYGHFRFWIDCLTSERGVRTIIRQKSTNKVSISVSLCRL